jgi:hypothetical protein
MDSSEDYMGDDEADFFVPPEQESMNIEQPNHNVRELEMLRREIDFIMEHGLRPPLSWYEKRIHNIQTYSELGWYQMAERFNNLDHYIHSTALNILNNIEEQLEHYRHEEIFHLRHYQHMIHDIEEVWKYYQTTYIGNESDPDVGDLIVGLTHLMHNM